MAHPLFAAPLEALAREGAFQPAVHARELRWVSTGGALSMRAALSLPAHWRHSSAARALMKRARDAKRAVQAHRKGGSAQWPASEVARRLELERAARAGRNHGSAEWIASLRARQRELKCAVRAQWRRGSAARLAPEPARQLELERAARAARNHGSAEWIAS